MIEFDDAEFIVHSALGHAVSPRLEAVSADDIELSRDALGQALGRVKASRIMRCYDLQVEPVLTLLIDDLRLDQLVMAVRMSASKLCTNPETAHPQTCCPYPSRCPVCDYPV